MKKSMKTTLAAVLAVSAACFAVSAVAATTPAKSAAQEAAELDGNAFLDTGNDSPEAPPAKASSPAVASQAPIAKATSPEEQNQHGHKSLPPARVGELMTKADEKRRREHPEKHPAIAAVPVSAPAPVAHVASSAFVASAPAAPATQAIAAAQTSAQPVTPKPPSEAAVINPMTGQSLGTEELKGELATATLRAEIAAQNFKAAQAESQLSQLRFMAAPPAGGPLPPKAVTLADVPKTVKVEPKETHKHEEAKSAKAPAVAAAAAPTVLPTSPVTGIMSEGVLRYALLQLDGKGEMASAGQTVHGRHVDEVRADGVVLDGHFYPIAAPVTEIASVDEQRAATSSTGHSPVVYGSVSTERVSTPNPFAHNANGGLPPLNAILARGQ